MDFKKLNDYAMEASRNALKSRFDFVAYIAYAIAVDNVNAKDDTDIPGTEIDDNIKNVFGDFVKYYQKKKNDEQAEKELEKMLETLTKILTELYYQGTKNEKIKISNFISEIAKSLDVGR